jgi:hypothetical protein
MDEKLIARFWERVERRGPDDCWPWLGARNDRDYGVGWDGKRTRLAHRIAWFLTHGEWPVDCLCHRCDNPPCCNPAHAFEGSRADNLADMRKKGRAAPMPRRDLHGEHHPGVQLTEASVREIIARGEGGEPYASLALEFGVTASNIAAILNGRSWKHLPRAPLRRNRKPLDPERAEAVRALLAAGKTQREVADALDVGRATVASISSGRWRL